MALARNLLKGLASQPWAKLAAMKDKALHWNLFALLDPHLHLQIDYSLGILPTMQNTAPGS